MGKQHIIYRITNLLNNRFYVGMHTGYPDDGYLGSGKRIKAEIKKYSKENFKKDILEILPTRRDLERREAEIVNEELLANPLCLNLKNGGEGGGKFWNKEHHFKASSSGGKKGGKISGRSNGLKVGKFITQKAIERGNLFTLGMLGKNHSVETKRQMSIAGSGEKNSQFGTCWVTRDSKSMKIKKEQLGEYLANGYSRGRK